MAFNDLPSFLLTAFHFKNPAILLLPPSPFSHPQPPPKYTAHERVCTSYTTCIPTVSLGLCNRPVRLPMETLIPRETAGLVELKPGLADSQALLVLLPQESCIS